MEIIGLNQDVVNKYLPAPLSALRMGLDKIAKETLKTFLRIFKKMIFPWKGCLLVVCINGNAKGEFHLFNPPDNSPVAVFNQNE